MNSNSNTPTKKKTKTNRVAPSREPSPESSAETQSPASPARSHVSRTPKLVSANKTNRKSRASLTSRKRREPPSKRHVSPAASHRSRASNKLPTLRRTHISSASHSPTPDCNMPCAPTHASVSCMPVRGLDTGVQNMYFMTPGASSGPCAVEEIFSLANDQSGRVVSLDVLHDYRKFHLKVTWSSSPTYKDNKEIQLPKYKQDEEIQLPKRNKAAASVREDKIHKSQSSMQSSRASCVSYLTDDDQDDPEPFANWKPFD